jgi:hypothetical protein
MPAPDKRYLYGKKIQDGSPLLSSPSCGRMVIYKNRVSVSRGPSQDHNDLLRVLIAQWNLNKERDKVISGASRYYYYREKNSVYISPVRKIDDDDFYQNQEPYTRLMIGILGKN